MNIVINVARVFMAVEQAHDIMYNNDAVKSVQVWIAENNHRDTTYVRCTGCEGDRGTYERMPCDCCSEWIDCGYCDGSGVEEKS